MIATNDNETKLYYSSKNLIGKQTYAYVTSSDKKILAVDVSKTNVPGSHWAEIADGLHIEIKKLINTKHPDFIKEYGDEKIDLDQHDWLRILENHPETLAFPVAIIGNKFVAIHSPSDFAKHIDPDTTNQPKPYK